jgi:hypothetical protein
MNHVGFTKSFDACVGHAVDGSQFVRDFPAKAGVLKDKGDYIHFEGKDGKSYKATRTGTGPNDFKVTPS